MKKPSPNITYFNNGTNLIFIAFLPLIMEAYYQHVISPIILYVIYTCLLYSVSFFIKRYTWVFLLPLLILSFLESPYIFLTKSGLSNNVVASVFESNASETIEFLASPFALKYLTIFCFLIVFSFFFVRLRFLIIEQAFYKNNALLTNKKQYFIVGLCIFSIVVFHYVNKKDTSKVVHYSGGVYSHFPLKTLIVFKRAVFETAFVIHDFKSFKIEERIHRAESNKLSVVLVIGESARRNALGIYNSKLETSDELIKYLASRPNSTLIFSDALSVAPFTRVAVPSMLSVSSAQNYGEIGSSPSLYKIVNRSKEGRTHFIGKRNPKLFHEQLISSFIDENSLIYNVKSNFDNALFDQATTIQNTDFSSSLMTIHLSGSHYKYKERYPKTEDCISPSIPEAAYLNSIRYTDKLLTDFYINLDRLKKPIVTIYISDHGEYVNDNLDSIFGHGYSQVTKNEIEIPMLFTFNKTALNSILYRNMFIELSKNTSKKVSLDNISHTVLGLMGVSSNSYYKSHFDLSSPNFLETDRHLINRDMNIKKVKELSFSTVNHNVKKLHQRVDFSKCKSPSLN